MGGPRVLERREPRPPDGRARARAAARRHRSGLSRPAGTPAPILPPVLGAVLTAAVTPFDESGGVDEAAYRTLVRRLLDSGSDG
ncbi:MAG: dihydrodipicolinate synthase family protein, partial [Miltoncostaeaceae bacterium]